MGQRTGMAYNYLKVILEELQPDAEYAAQLSSLSKKGNQQVYEKRFS